MQGHISLLAIAASIVLTGCAAGTSKAQYQTVRISYAYGVKDKSEREWRAGLKALDECHNEGYQDAYPAGQPTVLCDQGADAACTHFQASKSYDCVGMGYQTL